MNISFYLVLIGLAFIAGGVVAAYKKLDSDTDATLFVIGLILCIVVAQVEFAVTYNSKACAIDGKEFSTITCVVKPNEKPVRIVYYQKCLFKKTAMKTETVLPGQVGIFKNSIIIAKNEIGMPF